MTCPTCASPFNRLSRDCYQNVGAQKNGCRNVYTITSHTAKPPFQVRRQSEVTVGTVKRFSAVSSVSATATNYLPSSTSAMFEHETLPTERLTDSQRLILHSQGKSTKRPCRRVQENISLPNLDLYKNQNNNHNDILCWSLEAGTLLGYEQRTNDTCWRFLAKPFLEPHVRAS